MTASFTLPNNSWRRLLIGAGGGLASVAMFYSAARGGVGFSMLLLPLVPLPLMIAGFGWGLPAAIAAAVTSTIALAFAVAPSFAAGYACSLALPVIGLTHLLTLARYNPDGTLVDWFPAGRILMAIALYGAALPVLMIALEGGSYALMAPEFTRFFNQLAAQAPIGSSWRTMDAAQIQSLVDLWVKLMPGVIASYWTIFFAINAYLAARIVRISGRFVRPWPNLHWLTFPPLFALAFLAAIGGVAIGGSLRELGIGAIGAFSVAFLLQGLSVIHAIAKQRAATWLISAVYAAIIVGGALAMPLITVLGLAETVTRLRSRIVPIPPALPLGSI